MAKQQAGAVRTSKRVTPGAFGGYNLGDNASTTPTTTPASSTPAPTTSAPIMRIQASQIPLRTPSPLAGPTNFNPSPLANPASPNPLVNPTNFNPNPLMPASTNLNFNPSPLTNPTNAPTTTTPIGSNPTQSPNPLGYTGTPSVGRQAVGGTAGNLASSSQSQTSNWINSLLGLMSTPQGVQQSTAGPAVNAFLTQLQTGGYDPAALATLRANLANLYPTGGVDPTQLSNVQGNLQNTYNTATGFTGPSGSMDPSLLASITGGYQNLANTGGMTPEQQQNYLRVSTSGVLAIYDALARQAQLEKSRTGGLGTGGDISQLARQLSQDQTAAASGAENTLAQNLLAGKVAGLGGLSTTGATTGSERLQAAGLGGTTAGTQGNLATNVANLIQGGAGLQSGLESGVATGSRAAAAGLGSLYDASTGQISDLGNQVLSALGLNFTNQNDALNALVAIATASPQGPLSNIIGFMTAAGQLGQGIGGAAEGIGGG